MGIGGIGVHNLKDTLILVNRVIDGLGADLGTRRVSIARQGNGLGAGGTGDTVRERGGV